MAEPSLLQSYVAGQQAPAAPAPTRELTNVYDAQGNPLPIEDVGPALSDGRAHFDADQEYSLLDAGGSPRVVAGDQVYNALRQGWQLESTEEKELRRARADAGFAEGAAATGLGALESLTFGTAPAIAEIVGGQSAGSAYKRITEASPSAHTLGEVLGLVSPAGVEGLAARGLTKGATGAVARGVTAAPRALSGVARGTGEAVAAMLPEATTSLGKALQKGVKFGVEGAVEGSVYGLGYTVGEAALGDKELTAERLLAGAGTGALLGASVGGGLGLAAGAAPAVARRFEGGVTGFAERQAWKSTGATGENTATAGLAQAKRSGRRMLDEGLVKFESFEQRAEALRTATHDAGEQIGKLIDRLDGTGARPDVRKIVDGIEEQLGELRKGDGADVRLARRIDRDHGDWFRDRLDPTKTPSFREVRDIRARIDVRARAAFKQKDTVLGAQYDRLRNTIEDEITRQADSLAPQVGDDFVREYTAAKSRFQDLKVARDVANQRAPYLEAGNRSISLTDTIAMAGGLAHGALGGVAMGVGNKLLREYGDTASALLANRLGRPSAKAPSLTDVMSGAVAANDTTPTLYNQLITGEIPESLWKFDRAGMREASSGPLAKAYSGADNVNDIATGRAVPPGSKEPLPPIQLVIDGAEVQLRDGRHRLQQAQAAGATEIRATLQDIDDFHENGPWPLNEEIQPVIIAIPGRGGPSPEQTRSKLEALGYVKEKADKVAIAISSGTREAIQSDTHGIVARGAAKTGSYEAYAGPAQEHRAAPDRSAAKIALRAAALVESAPELHRAVVAKATGDAEYLAQALPRAAASGGFPGQEKAIQPAASERASFVRKARAIQEPQSAIFDMKNGSLSADAVQALKERRPLLLQQIVDEAENAYAELVRDGKAPSRQTRLQLEKLTGVNHDPASSPIVIKFVQKHYADKAAAQAQPPAPTSTAPSAERKTDRVMSQSEAIARGGT